MCYTTFLCIVLRLDIIIINNKKFKKKMTFPGIYIFYAICAAKNHSETQQQQQQQQKKERKVQYFAK